MPEWFIKLFTQIGDTVLDPFMGSGTTNFVAQRMNRNSIGIEILPEYFHLVKNQITPVKLVLFESEISYEKNNNRRGQTIR